MFQNFCSCVQLNASIRIALRVSVQMLFISNLGLSLCRFAVREKAETFLIIFFILLDLLIMTNKRQMLRSF